MLILWRLVSICVGLVLSIFGIIDGTFVSDTNQVYISCENQYQDGSE